MDTEANGSLFAETPQPDGISRPYKDPPLLLPPFLSWPLLPHLAHQYMQHHPSWPQLVWSIFIGWLLWGPVLLRKNLIQYRRCLGPSGHTVWRAKWASLPWQCTCVQQTRNLVPLGKGKQASSSQQKAWLPMLCCCWASVTARNASAPWDSIPWGNSQSPGQH